MFFTKIFAEAAFLENKEQKGKSNNSQIKDQNGYTHCMVLKCLELEVFQTLEFQNFGILAYRMIS